ncbi:hypothetical protein ACFLVB_03830 [Chloroflexota bacterium]
MKSLTAVMAALFKLVYKGIKGGDVYWTGDSEKPISKSVVKEAVANTWGLGFMTLRWADPPETSIDIPATHQVQS